VKRACLALKPRAPPRARGRLRGWNGVGRTSFVPVPGPRVRASDGPRRGSLLRREGEGVGPPNDDLRIDAKTQTRGAPVERSACPIFVGYVMRNQRAPLFRAPGTMSRAERLALFRFTYRLNHPEPPAAARGYDADWQRLRRKHLADEPLLPALRAARHRAPGADRRSHPIDPRSSRAPPRRLEPAVPLLALSQPQDPSPKTMKKSSARGGILKIRDCSRHGPA
jgi:hypothetical protein